MDIILALLPWKVVWPLNMRKKEKIGAIIAMSMGVFAGITGIIKLAQTPRMKEGDVCKFTSYYASTCRSSLVTLS